uniref:U11-Eretoxin-Ek1ah_1 n=1 Tax=Eresus cinnaberinus TaxID=175337 RepID=A0A2D0PCE0_ERECI
MVSHVTSIVSLFALLLGLAECSKMSICEVHPTAQFLQSSKILNVLFWNEDYNQLTNNVLVDLHNMYREKVASGKETQAGKLPTATNTV